VSGGFSAWKARAAIRLLQLKKKYSGAELAAEIDELIARLKRLRRRDLHSFLAQLSALSERAPEVLEIAPSEEDVERWLREGEGA
jgi:tRNA isopentenyl-2-thiomethyl-A-37 hydroxylase MiaE